MTEHGEKAMLRLLAKLVDSIEHLEQVVCPPKVQAPAFVVDMTETSRAMSRRKARTVVVDGEDPLPPSGGDVTPEKFWKRGDR